MLDASGDQHLEQLTEFLLSHCSPELEKMLLEVDDTKHYGIPIKYTFSSFCVLGLSVSSSFCRLCTLACVVCQTPRTLLGA